MDYRLIPYDQTGVAAELSTFMREGGVTEHHAILYVEPRGELFAGQLSRLMEAVKALKAEPDCAGARIVFMRLFLSDAANQQQVIDELGVMKDACNACSISCIQQPPLDGSKVAAWLYLVHDMDVERQQDGLVIASHNGYKHLWQMGLCCPTGDSAAQTESLLVGYEELLKQHGATLADNCIRTWFYVRDVDTQYAGMVRARRENFVLQGLTEKTHYIASTGIGGVPADTKAIVQLGTYALTGFLPQQQRYLYAKTHLNSTYEYGVTFERGTVVDFGDRSHVFISGTASINNRGEVEHVGDIVKQTERMWENVSALLAEADSSFDDVAQIIVYLRDTGDYATVKALFEQRFPQTPYVITLAPVCRPAWLIEMECVAIRTNKNPEYRNF